MVRPKMEPGTTRIGHVVSTDEPDAVASVTFDDRGVVLTWPRELGFIDAFKQVEVLSTFERLVFRDANGWLTLRDGRSMGSSASTTGSSEERLRFSCALHTGARGIDYSSVDGMSSEVDGLGRWAKMSAVHSELRFEDGRPAGVSILAQNLDDRGLGGPLNLTLGTSYTHSPTPRGGVYSILDALRVRTTSSELVPWGEHAAAHHMIQDLMCLVYGKPVGSRLVAVMREDDQPMEPKDERRFWVDAYQPSFGRGGSAVEPLPDSAEPLFYLDEADASRVAGWLTEFQMWSRPTWIGVTTLFEKASPVEVLLLQTAIALEALGHSLWRRDNPDGKRAPTDYQGLVKRVTDVVPSDIPGIYDDATPKAWRAGLSAAYRATKHPEHRLPDGAEAYRLWKQAFTLIRCWLAIELGVEPDLVLNRLAEGR